MTELNATQINVILHRFRMQALDLLEAGFNFENFTVTLEAKHPDGPETQICWQMVDRRRFDAGLLGAMPPLKREDVKATLDEIPEIPDREDLGGGNS
jgi:hypothetical protein